MLPPPRYEGSVLISFRAAAADMVKETSSGRVMGHPMKASDLFVAALENEGVQYIFGVPGALMHADREQSAQLALIVCVYMLCSRRTSRPS